ncbi:hypothetical protein SLS62_003719 [Diatrype stigma]|uniref:Uncharacterized protein n=1 Tax=Diatrype stigma TaxID=117547 RepID=A0AAN9V4N3_9PEZI
MSESKTTAEKPLPIHYGTAKLPGYLYFPDKQNASGISPAGKVPVVINTNGFDSVQEGLYSFTASGRIPRLKSARRVPVSRDWVQLGA